MALRKVENHWHLYSHKTASGLCDFQPSHRSAMSGYVLSEASKRLWCKKERKKELHTGLWRCWNGRIYAWKMIQKMNLQIWRSQLFSFSCKSKLWSWFCPMCLDIVCLSVVLYPRVAYGTGLGLKLLFTHVSWCFHQFWFFLRTDGLCAGGGAGSVTSPASFVDSDLGHACGLSCWPCSSQN